MRRAYRLLIVLLGALPIAPAAAQQDSTRTAVLDGVVHDSLGTPLEGAVVTIEALGRTVLSDGAGRFRVGGLPSDTLDVSVRRVGFAPAYFAAAIPPATTVSVAVKMLPNAVKLGTIVVEGEARDITLSRSGFYDRKRFGNGVFLGPEFMGPRKGLAASTVMREVPRVRVQCVSGGMRGCRPLLGGSLSTCAPDIFVDDMLVRNPGTDFDAIVDTRYVVGIEVYRTLLETPPQYQRVDTNCGSIVVWTEFAPRATRRKKRATADSVPGPATRD